jgi:acyl-CoA synthetase (AMP-forming)/AMP-acid ligase II
MPLSGPPLNEPVDLRRLLRTGLETRADEIALVYVEGGHTWRELDRASDRRAANG